MGTEERILRLENAFSTLVEQARTQNERMDECEHSSEELAEVPLQTETHLSALAEIMVDLGRAQTRTKAALTSLTERLEQYISSRNGK